MAKEEKPKAIGYWGNRIQGSRFRFEAACGDAVEKCKLLSKVVRESRTVAEWGWMKRVICVVEAGGQARAQSDRKMRMEG